MAHEQQRTFCNFVKFKFPNAFTNKIVLDVGSLNINGCNKPLFENCIYTGVDLLPGENVDYISTGHALSFSDNSFDTMISTECFEHDRHYSETIKNMVRMLKPGGLLVFTCASTGRPEHGTRRTSVGDAPFLMEFGDWGDYYKNLTENDIREILSIEENFQDFQFTYEPFACDLYFWGIKRDAIDETHTLSPTLSDGNGKVRDIFYDQLSRRCIKWSNYFDIYETHLNKFVNKNPIVLEIGVFAGGSLELWKKYFGDGATIIGVDIDENVISTTPDNCTTIIGNQGDPLFWDEFFKQYPVIDVVIDDGSHQYDHQITSLEKIFPHLNLGGVYLCEDTCCNYWDSYGGGLTKPTFTNYTKAIVDALNADHFRPEDLTVENVNFADYYRLVSAVHFYTSVVVIDKNVYKKATWAENFPNRL